MKSKYMDRPAFYELDAIEEVDAIRLKFFFRQSRDCRSVLEFGSGTGQIALHLADHGKTVTCVDSSKPSLDILRAKVFASGKWDKQVTIVDGDACHFSSPHKFDLILLPSLMHLVLANPARTAILRNSHRLLKPGGKLVATFLTLNKLNYVPAKGTYERKIGDVRYRRQGSIRRSPIKKNQIDVVWKFEEHGPNVRKSFQEKFPCRCDEIDDLRGLLGETGFTIHREFIDYAGTVYRSSNDVGNVIFVCRKVA